MGSKTNICFFFFFYRKDPFQSIECLSISLFLPLRIRELGLEKCVAVSSRSYCQGEQLQVNVE